MRLIGTPSSQSEILKYRDAWTVSRSFPSIATFLLDRCVELRRSDRGGLRKDLRSFRFPTSLVAERLKPLDGREKLAQDASCK